MIELMGMVRAWVPGSEAELAVIRSLLDAHGIAYFVQGDTHMNKASMMLVSHPMFGKAVWVEESDLPVLRELTGHLEKSEAVQTDIAADAFMSFWRRVKKFFGYLFLGSA